MECHSITIISYSWDLYDRLILPEDRKILGGNSQGRDFAFCFIAFLCRTIARKCCLCSLCRFNFKQGLNILFQFTFRLALSMCIRPWVALWKSQGQPHVEWTATPTPKILQPQDRYFDKGRKPPEILVWFGFSYIIRKVNQRQSNNTGKSGGWPRQKGVTMVLSTPMFQITVHFIM